MKRLLLLCTVFLTVTAAVFAGDNTRKKAAAFAKVSEKSMQQVMAGEGFRIYNNGQQPGFVIVSTMDDNEILGYSDRNFDSGNIPTALKTLLDGYSARAASAKTSSLSGEYKKIAPFINTQWGQDEPFNTQCPVFDDGQAPTGCIATAMAQIMNFYRFPDALPALPAYDVLQSLTKTVLYTQTESLEAASLDWSKMKRYYKAADESDEAKEVAKLMRYCGQAVSMWYQAGGSNAYNSQLTPALINKFGYDKDITTVERRNFTYQEWFDLLYGEMRQFRPVVIMAQNSAGDGHAFLCDGYDSGEYFHINWGWAGMADGYYRISVLTPEIQGTGGSLSYDGYNMNYTAAVGIQPENNTDDEIVKGSVSRYSLKQSLKAEGHEYVGNMKQYSMQELRLVVTNTGDDFYSNVMLKAGGEYVSGCCMGIAENATDTVIFRFSPETAGKLALDVYVKNFNGDPIFTDTINVTEYVAGQPKLAISVDYDDMYDLQSAVVSGSVLTGKVNVTNNSDTVYNDYIGVRANRVLSITDTGSGTRYSGETDFEKSGLVTIQPGETVSWKFSINGLSDGEQYWNTVFASNGYHQYSFSSASSAIYTCSAAPVITISARSYTREYGDENPDFGYVVSGGSVSGAPEIVCGAGKESPAGVYPIVVKKGTVTEDVAEFVEGTLTITKAPLKVSTDNYTREVGEDNPEFVIRYEGFKNDDTEASLTKKATATTTAGKDSPEGVYDIVLGGAESPDYDFSYTNGRLTVTPSSAIISVAADAVMDIYTVEGVLVKKDARSLEGLPKGVYIAGGKKRIVR